MGRRRGGAGGPFPQVVGEEPETRGRGPGFLSLLGVYSDTRRRAAAVVLVYDVSRFSRPEPDEAACHEFSLRRAGVTVIYTHDPAANDSGGAGFLVKSVKRFLAHDYSQKLSEVVRRGHRTHAALGHSSGGRPPYGYRRAIARLRHDDTARGRALEGARRARRADRRPGRGGDRAAGDFSGLRR